MTAAELFVRCLELEGVRYVFERRLALIDVEIDPSASFELTRKMRKYWKERE